SVHFMSSRGSDYDYCGCVPTETACNGGEPPQCGGICPAGSRCALSFVDTPSGTFERCQCSPIDCGGFQPSCGVCPPGQKCVPSVGGMCSCESVRCGASATPECDGSCENVGEICYPLNDTTCGCLQVGCGSPDLPQCAGECPLGEACTAQSGGCM